MKLPARVAEIVRALYDANKNLAHGTDDDRRQLTTMMNEQIALELGPKWGAKRADSGRPISKDSIAFNDAPNLWIWDWQDGSTRMPGGSFVAGAEGKNVGEGQPEGPQVFVPVTPTNHLGASQPQQPPTTTPPSTPPVDPSFERDVRESLGRVELMLKKIADGMKPNPFPVPPPLDITFPNYEGETILPLPTFLGGSRPVKVVLKPKENS